MNLARYEVVRELGKGAMGVVYLAKDPLIGRLVALKTIRASAATDDEDAREFRQRFTREAQAAGILSHPSIVTVHDIGDDTASGVSFIAMEYVEGRTLKEIIATGDPLPFEETAQIVAQVADALDYAHAKGIIHRDVKPANIILCGDSRAKITDFGIAKIATFGNLTSTGQFLGTPNYMSPEQVKGSAVDGRSDLFSLGIVLYEALTRRKPFSGDSLTTISYKIVHEPYLSLREINPRIPEEFEDIVRRCLAKDPADRFERARDVATALREVIRLEQSRKAGEPLLFEQTQVADSSRMQTIETPVANAAAVSSAAAAVEDRGTVSVKKPAAKSSRARELMRRPVAPAIFFGTILLLLAAIGVAAGLILQQNTAVPPSDLAKERLVAQQRALRVRAAELLAAGQVDQAYETYLQLRQTAPDSPAVKKAIAEIEFERFKVMSKQQRLNEATAKLNEGRRLYELRKYPEAITLFEEAFHLDPESETAVNYLRMTREQLALTEVRERPSRRAAATPAAVPEPAPVDPAAAAAAAAPAALVTILNSPVADGTLLVKVNGDTILNEPLYEERRGILKRRAPRQINVYREVRAHEADVQLWVLIPSLKITEHRKLTMKLEPGKVHRLVITVDPATKRVDVSG